MNKFLLLTSTIVYFFYQPVFASEEDDIAEMQKQMNAEVMSKAFLAEQPAKVDAYIKDAMKKNIKPIEYSGTHWRSGYTCRGKKTEM